MKIQHPNGPYFELGARVIVPQQDDSEQLTPGEPKKPERPTLEELLQDPRVGPRPITIAQLRRQPTIEPTVLPKQKRGGVIANIRRHQGEIWEKLKRTTDASEIKNLQQQQEVLRKALQQHRHLQHKKKKAIKRSIETINRKSS